MAPPAPPDPVSSVVAAVGDITVGAKSPACPMPDAAFVAVAVVNCLVIVAAAVASVAAAPDVAPVVVWHLSYVVEGQTSSFVGPLLR